MKRIDERDTMFARMAWSRDSEAYRDYYERHPEKKQADDSLREMPNLLAEGTATYHPIHGQLPEGIFRFLGDIGHLVDGDLAPVQQEVAAEEITKRIKKIMKHFGAMSVGVTRLRDYHLYSHRGRREENYGQRVGLDHEYAIAFTYEMDQDMINRAPQMEEVIEVTKGYLDAAIGGMVLSYFIRGLGYEARNHMDGNYLLVAPLVAADAGLGELSRMGVLMTQEAGPRVRLGVVTTNLPLLTDEPISFGATAFCKACGICSMTCPGKAIPKGGQEEIDGIKRWKINQESCYEMWRRLGTDCGVCLSACPFSQGLTPVNYLEEPEKIMAHLQEHTEKYGPRNYLKFPLDILR